MENKRPTLVYMALILSIGLVITAVIIGRTWRTVSRNSVTITVTGSAQKEIRSDLAQWSGSFQGESANLQDAYAKLQSSSSKVKAYLISKGFPEDKLQFSSISTQVLYATDEKGKNTNIANGYRLTQEVSMESGDVDKIDKLSREVTELINQGVQMQSSPPRFFYTKLSDLKIEMIGLASKDAKTRAEQVAESTGNKVGEVRSSKMGVMQINSKNSTDITDYGVNDTSSLDKTITAVVNMSFSIE